MIIVIISTKKKKKDYCYYYFTYSRIYGLLFYLFNSYEIISTYDAHSI